MKKDRKKQAKAANRRANAADGSAADEEEVDAFSPPSPAVDLAAALAVSRLIAEDDTEALVLLTVVDRYDVTRQMKGWLGRLLTRMLGSEGCSAFQPLVLRMGLLAFQWPFRTSVVFLQPSSRPSGRAAACLRAVVEWNEAQLPADRCDLLLLPSMKVQSTLVAAVEPAGFFSLPLPSSHMQDLRPYHRIPDDTAATNATANAAWQAYLRAMKKGNRRDLVEAFEREGGTVLHVDDSAADVMVSDERIGEALRL